MERRRRKNKKRKESKKANKKNNQPEVVVISTLDEEAEEPEKTAEALASDSGYEAAETEEKKDVELIGEEKKKDGENEKEVKKEEMEGEEQKKVKEKSATDDLAVEIEYVGEGPELDESDPNFNYFSRIFNAFKVFYLKIMPKILIYNLDQI